MFDRVVCHPPLETVSTIRPEQTTIPFTVLFHLNKPECPAVEAEVWHNFAGPDDWESFPLVNDPFSSHLPVFGSQSSPPNTWVRFGGAVPRPQNTSHTTEFTIRYRTVRQVRPQQLQTSPDLDADWEAIDNEEGEEADFDDSDGWLWSKQQFSVQNGVLLFLDPIDTADGPAKIGEYLAPIDAKWTVSPAETGSWKPALAWKLTCRIAATLTEKEPFRLTVPIGRVKRPSRWFSLVRKDSNWLVPVQGGFDQFCIDKDSLLVAFERQDGRHVVIVPMSGTGGTTSVLRSGDDGKVEMRTRNDDTFQGTATVIVAVAETYSLALSVAFNVARSLTGTRQTVNQLSTDPEPPYDCPPGLKLNEDAASRDDLKPVDNLTFCTWNSIGANLTQDRILEALESLRQHGIAVSHLIVDDNWQHTHFSNRLIDFEADKRVFPNGLKHMTRSVRERHPSIREISVWHTMFGYWNALSPTGKLAKQYSTRWVNRSSAPPTRKELEGLPDDCNFDGWLVFDQHDVGRAYSDFFQFLAKSGVTGVKTDFQAALDLFRFPTDRRDLIKPFQSAWLNALERHFEGRGIACMAMAPVLMFDSQLQANHRPLPVRVSDDFFPHIPPSHPWHLWSCAHSSTMVGNLNAIPDWDMFISGHEWGQLHAVGRCISGGPIILTDPPGQHDGKLVRKISASNRAGRVVTLRPSGKGVTPTVYGKYKDAALLKVRNYVVGPNVLAHLVAYFNLGQSDPARTIDDVVSIEDLVGLDANPAQSWVVRSSKSGLVAGPFQHDENEVNSKVLVSLPPRDWELLTAHAVYRHSTKLSIAPLGLSKKITGVAAISSISISSCGPADTSSPNNPADSTGTQNQVRISCSLRGGVLGTVGFWISNLTDSSPTGVSKGTKKWQDSIMVDVDNQAVGQDLISIGRQDDNVLEVDVARFAQDKSFVPAGTDTCVVRLTIIL